MTRPGFAAFLPFKNEPEPRLELDDEEEEELLAVVCSRGVVSDLRGVGFGAGGCGAGGLEVTVCFGREGVVVEDLVVVFGGDWVTFGGEYVRVLGLVGAGVELRVEAGGRLGWLLRGELGFTGCCGG